MTPEEIEKAAFDYAVKHSSAPDKETPDWIIADFKAGVKWAMERYASQFYSEEQVLEAIDLAREPKDYHGYKYSIRQILNELKAVKQPEEH